MRNLMYRSPFGNMERYGEMLLNKMISKGVGFASDTIKSRYGFEIRVPAYRYGDNGIRQVNKWIEKYDPKYSERVSSIEPNLKNKQFLFSLGDNTFCMVIAGLKQYSDNELIGLMIDSRDRGSSGGRSQDTDLYLYIFGKKSYIYKKEIEDILNKIAEELYVYNVSGNSNGEREEFNSIVSDMHQRQLDTLFFDDGVKETIIGHIDTFLKNESVYKERDLLFKTGILMHGKPGTGKSSLANAIATHYKCSLIIVDMNTFPRLDTVALSQSINADNDRYVILLEDIDCIFNSLNRGENGDNTEIDKEEKRIINKLLQFLDSNSSPNNVIFLATTNHINQLEEYLDEAILRSGRFDLKVEVGPINRPAAVKMCESFNLSTDTIDTLLADVKFPINQSKLQNMILGAIEGKEKKEEETNETESE